jgi:hypothetical protein
MKKAAKPAIKKTTQKKPTAKRLPATKPKRKAQGQSALAAIVARLGEITEQLAQTADRLAQMGLPAAVAPPAAVPVFEAPRTDEHADDAEVASAIPEDR